ncbi:hypothetical protein FOZ62_024748 [Perkinsus olseni]|uniref:Uncharacterized protein n=1 Tax=Perkinsus olseni TaxID=32597 RepID=A0A7J6UC50_PEROL|nr:hypothetical protein FOZ62_024748 [Perkinsus olseni]
MLRSNCEATRLHYWFYDVLRPQQPSGQEARLNLKGGKVYVQQEHPRQPILPLVVGVWLAAWKALSVSRAKTQIDEE